MSKTELQWAIEHMQGALQAFEELDEYIPWRTDEESDIISMSAKLDVMLDNILSDLEYEARESGNRAFKEAVYRWL